MTSHAFWLGSRAAGVVALVMLSTSVMLGLAMAAGLPSKPAMKRRLRFAHEHVAVSALAAIAVHGGLLLGDPWLRPGLGGILVPFALHYPPLFSGLGILAGYLAALLGLSFHVRRRIGVRRWRRLHRLTPAVYALAAIHTLGAGSDAGGRWLPALVLAPAVAAAALLVVRAAPQEARA
ncbi:MAG TPA: ferric reductase-like transmembrane domain-containing protein [Solirubrobacteraceae bacterium]|jgi:sulfoxide reductase heme-binding subunit YedZ